MVVSFALVGALRVIGAGNDGSIPKEIHLDVSNGEQGRLEQRVSDVGQEMLLVADPSIPLGVDESTVHQGLESGGVPVDLRLIPHALKDKEFVFARIGL